MNTSKFSKRKLLMVSCFALILLLSVFLGVAFGMFKSDIKLGGFSLTVTAKAAQVQLAAGLYDTGTETLICSWQGLIDEGTLDETGAIITGNESMLAGDLVVPDSITSIPVNAYVNCWNLTCVTIPDSVTSIGAKAFSGCGGLTSITIPDSVTSIGDTAFGGCTGLATVNYTGTATQWSAITIASGNERLTGATFTYNYAG